MAIDKEKTLEHLNHIIDIIHSDELTDEEKERMTAETIEYFDTYVSPGWLKYRKSVSTNGAALEWKDYGA